MPNKLSIKTNQEIFKLIGDRLRAERLSRNIATTELSSTAGISRNTLDRMEGGRGGTLDTLVRIMRALQVADRLEAAFPPPAINPLSVKPATAGRKRASRKQPARKGSNV